MRNIHVDNFCASFFYIIKILFEERYPIYESFDTYLPADITHYVFNVIKQGNNTKTQEKKKILRLMHQEAPFFQIWHEIQTVLFCLVQILTLHCLFIENDLECTDSHQLLFNQVSL